MKKHSSIFEHPVPHTDSGRGLPVTNTPTPKPPTKPPAAEKPKSVPENKQKTNR